MATEKEVIFESKCECKFIGLGSAMDNRDCKVHRAEWYPCNHCKCLQYRPISEPPKEKPGLTRFWPKCICGHIAQDHN